MFTNLINQWHFKMYFRTRIVFPCILNHDKLARQSLRNKASVFNGKYCWLVIFRSSLMFFSFLVPYIETCNKCPTPSILYVTASEQRSNNRTALTFFMDVKSPRVKNIKACFYIRVVHWNGLRDTRQQTIWLDVFSDDVNLTKDRFR